MYKRQPPLRAAVAGKGEREAAELLLHYLHRAFPYKTDEAQFGIERTLFAEEMYYYPYSCLLYTSRCVYETASTPNRSSATWSTTVSSGAMPPI